MSRILRAALAGLLAFCGMNGLRLTLVISVAAGELDMVAAIAAVLERGTEPRP